MRPRKAQYARPVRRRSHRPWSVLPVLPVLLCTFGLLALAGCAAGPVDAVPPSPEGEAAGLCGALHKALPGTVDGLASRETDPASDFTAAWGDPAVVLRCGVPLPGVLTPGSAEYDPTTESVGVEDVLWLPEKRGDDGYLFTTVGRKANVTLRVPGKYHPNETDPLVDIAEAVRKTVPTRL